MMGWMDKFFGNKEKSGATAKKTAANGPHS